MSEKKILIANQLKRPLGLFLEPYAFAYTLDPGDTAILQSEFEFSTQYFTEIGVTEDEFGISVSVTTPENFSLVDEKSHISLSQDTGHDSFHAKLVSPDVGEILSKQYGGSTEDWVEEYNTVFVSRSEKKFFVKWYRNTKTWVIAETQFTLNDGA